jgi:hypothetical protein
MRLMIVEYGETHELVAKNHCADEGQQQFTQLTASKLKASEAKLTRALQSSTEVLGRIPVIGG